MKTDLTQWIVRRLPAACALLAIGLLTIVRYDVLRAGIRSFFLMIAARFTDAGAVSGLLTWDLASVWLAGFLWVGILLLTLLKAASPEFFDRLRAIVHILPHPSENRAPRSLRWKIGCSLLSALIFLAVEAPILAPSDPLRIGSLEKTRLLPPFSTASMPSPARGTESSEPEGHLSTLRNDLVVLRLISAPVDAGQESGQPVVFLLGTDSVGRDVLSRLIDGARTTLAIGFLAAAASVLLGALVGFFAGAVGRMADVALMWLVDVFLSIPSLFLVIMFAFFLGTSVVQLILALALSGWMGIARIIRGEVMHLREREFVQAARMLGRSTFAIIRAHLIPNILPTLLTTAILQVSDTVLAEAALGFLGYGVQPPVPSWGNMLGDAVVHLEQAWWLALFPGIALLLLLSSLQLMADGLRSGSRG